MKRASREIGLYGIVLLAVLIASWWTWTREPSTNREKQVSLSTVSQRDIHSLEHDNAKGTVVTLTRSDNALTGKKDIWIRVRAEGTPDKDGTLPEPVINRFRGNEMAETLWSRYSPFMAARDLGKPNSTRYEDFGFAQEDNPTVTLDTRKGRHTWALGRMGFGGRNRYVLDQGSQRAALVDHVAFQGFDRAKSKLRSRDLHRFRKLSDIEELVLTSGETTLTMEHRNRSERHKAYWSPVGDEETRSDTFGNWSHKLSRLSISDWVAPEGDADSVFELSYFIDGKKVAFLKLFKHQDKDKTVWLARTELTGDHLVKVNPAAEEIVRDLDSVLGSVSE